MAEENNQGEKGNAAQLLPSQTPESQWFEDGQDLGSGETLKARKWETERRLVDDSSSYGNLHEGTEAEKDLQKDEAASENSTMPQSGTDSAVAADQQQSTILPLAQVQPGGSGSEEDSARLAEDQQVPFRETGAGSGGFAVGSLQQKLPSDHIADLESAQLARLAGDGGDRPDAAGEAQPDGRTAMAGRENAAIDPQALTLDDVHPLAGPPEESGQPPQDTESSPEPIPSPGNVGAVIEGSGGTVSEDGEMVVAGILKITDPDAGEAAFVPSVTHGTYGDFQVHKDGTWLYSLDNDLEQIQALHEGELVTETVQVVSLDGTTHDLAITIHGTNDAPRIGTITEQTATEDGAKVSGQIRATDVDTGDMLSYSTTSAADGLIFHADGSYIFDPGQTVYQSLAAGETLAIAIPVTATDSHGASSTETLVITLQGSNDAPTVAGAVTLPSGSEDTIQSFTAEELLARVEDLDSTDSHSISQVSVDPAQGTLTLQNGIYTFTPAPNYHGEVSLSYTVSDPSGATVLAEASINLAAVADTAEIGGDSAGGVTEDGITSATGQLTITDPDAGEAHFQAGTVQGDHGSLVLTEDGAWTYTLDNDSAPVQSLGQDQSLSDTLTVTAADGTTHDLAITIHGTNDAPRIGTITEQTATEDGAKVSGQIRATDVDTGDMLSYSTTSAADGLIFHADGSYIFDPGQTVYQSLAAGETLAIAIPVTATDSHGASSTETLVITLQGSNDAPTVAGAVTLPSGSEDTIQSFTAEELLARVEDLDSTDSHSISQVSVDPAQGTLTLQNGIYTFTPAPNYHGEVSLSYTVSDPSGATVLAEASINLAAMADTAEIGGDSAGGVTEDGITSATGQLTITDPDAGEAHFQAGTVQGNYGTLEINEEGKWNYALDNNNEKVQALGEGEQAEDIIAVKSADGSEQKIAITIHGTNDVPVVSGPTSLADGHEDSSMVFSVADLLATASDVDKRDTLAVSNVAVDPAQGSLIDNADGTFTLKPAANYNGQVTITYDVTDGSDAVTTGATFQLKSVNDNPLAEDDAATSIAFELPKGGTIVSTGDDVTVVKGEIVAEGKAGSSVDTWTFHHNGGALTIDTLAESGKGYIDIDGDGVKDHIDLMMRLYDSGGKLVAVNDDSSVGNADGSTNDVFSHVQDAYLQLNNLPPGEYTLAIGSWDLSQQEVIDGHNNNNDTGLSYNHDQDIGPYQITFSGDISFYEESPLTTDEDSVLIIKAETLLANDTDADGDSLAIISVSREVVDAEGNMVGTAELDHQGNVVFTPGEALDALTSGESQKVSFTYTVSDGQGGSDTATATVNVIGSNDTIGPLLDIDSTANSVSENATNGTVVHLTAQAIDVDGDSVRYAIVDETGEAVSGSPFAVDSATGVVTVRDHSKLDFETASSHQLHIQATSTDGSTSTETFTVKVGDATIMQVTDLGGASDGTPVTLNIAGDHYDPKNIDDTGSAGAPQFRIKVNGEYISLNGQTTFTASANTGHLVATGKDLTGDGVNDQQMVYNANDSELFTFRLPTGTAVESVSVQFLNDAWDGGTANNDKDNVLGEDRNLVVREMNIGGTVLADGTIVGGVTYQAEDKDVSQYLTSGGDDVSGREVMPWSGTMTFFPEGVPPEAPVISSVVDNLNASPYDTTHLGSKTSGATAGVTVTGIYAPGSGSNLLTDRPELQTLSDHKYFDHGSLGNTGYNYMGGHAWFKENNIQTSGLKGGVIAFSDGTTGIIDVAYDGVSRDTNGDGKADYQEKAYVYYQAYDMEAVDQKTLSGKATPGTQVVLNIDGVDVSTVNVGSDGTWKANCALVEGEHSITATTINSRGNESNPSAVIKVLAGEPDLESVSDSGRSNSDDITRQQNVTLTGEHANPGETITVYDSDHAVVGTGTVDADGSWSVTTSALADGEHALRATATDSKGKESIATDSHTVTIDTQAPDAPVISSITEDPAGAIYDVSNPGANVAGAQKGTAVTGIYAKDSGVNLLDDAPELLTLSSHNYFSHSSLGHTGYNYMGGHDWFAANDISLSTLRGGVITFEDGTVGIIDAASNGVERDQNGDGISDYQENAYIYYNAYEGIDEVQPVVVSGNGEAGSTIEVIADGQSLGATVVGEDGVWTISGLGLIEGTHEIVAQQTDVAGNTSESSAEKVIHINTINGELQLGSPVGQTIDADNQENFVSEAAHDGDVVHLTAQAIDVDGDSVRYAIVDETGEAVSGSPFAVDSATGVVTVRDHSKLDFETASSHQLHIQATSTDGSTSTETFTVKVGDATIMQVTDLGGASDGTPVTLNITGDHYDPKNIDDTGSAGAPQFRIKVNGEYISLNGQTTFTASANTGHLVATGKDLTGDGVNDQQMVYNANDSELFTFRLPTGTAVESVSVQFLNDAWDGGTANNDKDNVLGEDRNLVVREMNIGGTVLADGTIVGGVTYQAEDKDVSQYLTSGGDDVSGREVMPWSGTMTFYPEGVPIAPTAEDSTLATVEDTAVTLKSTDFHFADQNAGDSLEAVRITAIEEHGSLTLGGQEVALHQEILRADIDSGKLVYTPGEDVSGQMVPAFDFQVSDGQKWSVEANALSLNISPVADAPIFDVTSTEGIAGTTFDISAKVALADTDTSEILGPVTISGVPPGAVLSAGKMISGGAPADYQATTLGIQESGPLSVVFEGETAGYQNSFGYYKIDPDTKEIGDVQMIWTNASLKGSGGSLIAGQSSADLDATAGDTLGFFIVADGNSKNKFSSLGEGHYEFRTANGQIATADSTNPALVFVGVTGAVTVVRGDVFHTVDGTDNYSLNSDGIRHTRGELDLDQGSVTIGFEDLRGGGDRDFDDCIFSIHVGEANVEAISATHQGFSTWQLNPEDLAGLQITLPENCKEDFSLTLSATSTELTGETATSTTVIPVSLVDHYADPPVELMGVGRNLPSIALENEQLAEVSGQESENPTEPVVELTPSVSPSGPENDDSYSATPGEEGVDSSVHGVDLAADDQEADSEQSSAPEESKELDAYSANGSSATSGGDDSNLEEFKAGGDEGSTDEEVPPMDAGESQAGEDASEASVETAGLSETDVTPPDDAQHDQAVATEEVSGV